MSDLTRFEGDPKIFMTKDGADQLIEDGQPLMDQGIENALLILLMSEDWILNDLFDDSDQHLKSRFPAENKKEITATNLIDTEQSAMSSLAPLVSKGIAGSIVAVTENPTSNQRETTITVTAPSGVVNQLILTTNGINWIRQATDPAYRKV